MSFGQQFWHDIPWDDEQVMMFSLAEQNDTVAKGSFFLPLAEGFFFSLSRITLLHVEYNHRHKTLYSIQQKKNLILFSVSY